MPPDWYLEPDTEALDPLLYPDQAGWIFGVTGPAVGLGWVMSSVLTVEANVRAEGALLDIEQTGSPRIVPWVTATLGAETTF